jgi:hypothetical protein
VIIRHQRASASKRGFRQLARYIRGRSEKPRATWFLAANLVGVTGPRDLELACRLVEAVHAQNTRPGNDRTYHMVISLHPEDRSLNGNELRRVVENLVETLGFADHEAHHGIDSFAHWTRKKLGPALQARELRSWNDLHEVCASLGVVLRPRAQQATALPTTRSLPASALTSAGSGKDHDSAIFPRPRHRTAGLVEGIRAVTRPGPSTAATRLEQLPRHRLSRAWTTQADARSPTEGDSEDSAPRHMA